MKKFTVKDFIFYNSPCFSCGSKTRFDIGCLNSETSITSILTRPVINANYTEVDISITYTDALKLYIFHSNNKILTNNSQALIKYLSTHRLYLISKCLNNKCGCIIQSQFLIFNLEKSYIEAVPISFEMLTVTDENNIYRIESWFEGEPHSNVSYTKKDTNKKTSLKLSLLPKFSFKNKQHFITKMKTIIIFS